ncbi:MAG: hypothetical protein A2046_08780 [Bacteroidetes bacterium GWA2_30_7]|nr:MAG: hypothetical protein A2046_08780 [Bacteroidetes bacterium GWA2_30_7]
MKKLNLQIAILLLTLFLPSLWKGSGVGAQNIAITDDDTYNADSSAMLDVKSISKGMLVPRMTTIQRQLINNPATGLLVFDTNEGSFYFYNGTSWLSLSTGDEIWNKTGSKVHLSDSTNKVGVGTSNPQNKFTVKGNTIDGNESIFAVVNSNGDTLFAVYPEGTRIFINDSPSKASGNKGGFAVGGFSPAKGTLTNEYLRVTPDSVRVYVPENNPAKASGSKGGFAVGGFSPAKTTPDSAYYMFSEREGFRVTFLTKTERDSIVNPAKSSIIFNTSDSCLQIFLGYWESIWCTSLNCIAPVVLSNPITTTAIAPGNATFIATFAGTRINYYWQESIDGGTTWHALGDGGTSPHYEGANNDTLVITSITTNQDQYMYRCYAYNTCGNATTNSATLNSCGAQLVDIRDGQSYNTILIGSQCWMAENLDIGLLIEANQENNAVIEKYCYDDDTVNCNLYGGLYTWNEMMEYGTSDNGNPGTTQGVCPTGWHLPTQSEWDELVALLGGTTVAGGKMKEAGLIHWYTPNTGGFNQSGFTARGGGYRIGMWNFTYLHLDGRFWSSTEWDSNSGKYYLLKYNNDDISVNPQSDKDGRAFSVRCIKD